MTWRLGEAEAVVLTAKAEGDAIRIMSKARQEATENEGKAAEALQTPVARQLAVLAKQAEIMKTVKNPVWMPPEVFNPGFSNPCSNGEIRAYGRRTMTATP